MLFLQKAIRNGVVISKQAGQCRTVMVTRPRVRMPFMEKAAFGVFMSICILITPAYIAINFKNYGAKEE